MRYLKYIVLFLPLIALSQGSIIFETPFESSAEWSVNGDPDNNEWEANDQTIILGSTNPRQGTGYVSLEAGNQGASQTTRVEMNIDRTWEPVWGQEFWIGFSFRIREALPNAVSYTHLTLPTNREV